MQSRILAHLLNLTNATGNIYLIATIKQLCNNTG